MSTAMDSEIVTAASGTAGADIMFLEGIAPQLIGFMLTSLETLLFEKLPQQLLDFQIAAADGQSFADQPVLQALLNALGGKDPTAAMFAGEVTKEEVQNIVTLALQDGKIDSAEAIYVATAANIAGVKLHDGLSEEVWNLYRDACLSDERLTPMEIYTLARLMGDVSNVQAGDGNTMVRTATDAMTATTILDQERWGNADGKYQFTVSQFLGSDPDTGTPPTLDRETFGQRLRLLAQAVRSGQSPTYS